MSNEGQTQSITILPQIEDLLYPLKPEELANLEASIRQYGVREPLCLWDRDGEMILVDGHNRYAVATRNGVPFSTTVLEFKDLDEVLDWVDKNQIGRRNLTDEERAVTLGRIYQRKLDAKRAAGRSRSSSAENDANEIRGDGERTSDALATEWNVGSATVKRASNFAEAVAALKEVGENGVAASRLVLQGAIKDAMTELPKVVKSHPEALPLLADRICDGATKVKDALKDYLAVPTEVGGGISGQTPVSASSLVNEYQDGASQADVLPNLQKIVGLGVMDGIQDPVVDTHSVNQIELQASVMYTLSELRKLAKLNPERTWQQMPAHIQNDFEKDIDELAGWLASFASCAASK